MIFKIFAFQKVCAYVMIIYNSTPAQCIFLFQVKLKHTILFCKNSKFLFVVFVWSGGDQEFLHLSHLKYKFVSIDLADVPT